MRSPARYFSVQPIRGDRVVLQGAEAHHLVHVMRGKPGTNVVVFDGGGDEFLAQIVQIRRSEVQLALLERRQADRELPIEIVLGISLPKGDRQRWLVEKAVELGVRRLVPLITCRGIAQPQASALARLRRGVIEASKQCGRNRLMEIAGPQAWSDFVHGGGPLCTRLLAHPAAENEWLEAEFGPSSQSFPVASTGPVLLAVGPEGGFTSEEVMLAVKAGWRVVDLGPRTLRVETAALALVAFMALSGRAR